MINLFIDSNIWLDLYYFSSNDLEEFSKLKELVNKEINLFIPNQVIYEINRNRDSKIDEAFKKFKDFKIEFPNLCKGYTEYTTFTTAYNGIKKLHKDLVNKVSDDIINQRLPADKIIFEISQIATKVIETPDIIQKAKLRFDRGNPPGKGNSLGDAINWETLLTIIPQKDELFFISSDKDYRNKSDETFNSFLKNEWETEKKSKIYFYQSLVQFLNTHKIDINLTNEEEKNNLIYRLSWSGTFAQTHTIINHLSSYEHFNDDQLNTLLNIAVNNGQVGSIITDIDLYAFFRKLIVGREDKIDRSEEINEILLKLKIMDE